MTIPFQPARYTARFATDSRDIVACQHLRHLLFYGKEGLDADRFDASCRHLMIEDDTGRLIATARLFEISSGADIASGYAAQFYDLAGLAKRSGPMIELGRFCISPDVIDVDALRTAWAAMAQIVDDGQIGFLFGCTSFPGTDPHLYGRAFAQLAQCHQGPSELSPRRRASETVPFSKLTGDGKVPMPPLLRSYLGMGGWVGDHAVIDRNLNTMHVFTCLEVAKIPPNRARALRALAQASPLP